MGHIYLNKLVDFLSPEARSQAVYWRHTHRILETGMTVVKDGILALVGLLTCYGKS